MRVCPICNRSSEEVLFKNHMVHLNNINLSYNVKYCETCNFGFANGVLACDTNFHNIYYKKYSKYDFPRDLSQISKINIERSMLGANFIHQYVKEDNKILDVGSSVGFLLRTLKDEGYKNVNGIDPAPNAGKVAKELFNVKVNVGTFESFQHYADYDVISLMAVFEHLQDPLAILAQLAPSLSKGTRIIIEVPDADTFGDYMSNEPLGEFSIEHINYFGIRALTILFEKIDFRLLGSESFRLENGNYSLFACFEKSILRSINIERPDLKISLEQYINNSKSKLLIIDRVISSIPEDTVSLYGAGSHSARLIVNSALKYKSIDIIYDQNINLHGKLFNNIKVEKPTREKLAKSKSPIVVSSFHAENSIHKFLQLNSTRRIIRLYNN